MINIKGKIWSGYAIAFVLLLASYLIIFYSNRRMRQATAEISMSHETTRKINGFNLKAIAAKNSVMDFYHSGDSTKLKPYLESLQQLPLFISEMNEEPGMRTQPAFDSLKISTFSLLSAMTEGIRHYRREPFSDDYTHNLMANRLRSIFSNMLTHSTALVDVNESMITQKISSLKQFLHTTQVITLISLLLAGALILYSLITFNKENKAKAVAREKVSEYSLELEKQIKELGEKNMEIVQLRNMEKFTSTGRIARTIAHEVRNPLTNISLAIEQLREFGIEHEDYRLLLDMISRNAVRINQLSDNLLNATKFEELKIKNYSVNQLLDETLEMAKDRIDLQHITVEKQYTPDICDVAVDEAKIKIALLNIIVNAIEAMEKETGVLRLRTSAKEDNCVIEIEDNGPGMDEDMALKIFEPFFTNKQKGTGLGLTNSQNIILNHKGSISIDSKRGKGSRFIINLGFAK